MTPPFTLQSAEHYTRMKSEPHAALCKRLIEDYWRRQGAQVFVRVEGAVLISDLVGGLPRQ